MRAEFGYRTTRPSRPAERREEPEGDQRTDITAAVCSFSEPTDLPAGDGSEYRGQKHPITANTRTRDVPHPNCTTACPSREKLTRWLQYTLGNVRMASGETHAEDRVPRTCHSSEETPTISLASAKCSRTIVEDIALVEGSSCHRRTVPSSELRREGRRQKCP